MYKLLIGVTFVNLCWPQAEIWLIYYVFLQKISINIHEYANELICIFEHQAKGQCLSLNLVPTLSLYVEHRLKYY